MPYKLRKGSLPIFPSILYLRWSYVRFRDKLYRSPYSRGILEQIFWYQAVKMEINTTQRLLLTRYVVGQKIGFFMR